MNCRVGRYLLPAAIAAAAASLPALAFHNENPQFTTAHWTETMTHSDPNGRVLDTTITKIWIKGDQQRIEVARVRGIAPNQAKGLSFIIVHGHDKYTLRTGAAKLVKTSLDAESVLYESKKLNERETGTATVDGKPCTTYQYETENDLGGLMTIRSLVEDCRWRGLSLRTFVRMESPPAGTGDSYTTELSDVQLDIPLDDRLFALPEHLPVEEKRLPTQQD